MPGMMKRGGMSDSGYGGDIPSPRQKGDNSNARPLNVLPENMERERAITLRALMERLEPSSSQMSDVPNMSPDEIAQYNRPAMDASDAFFGPDRKRFDIVEFITNLISGGR